MKPKAAPASVNELMIDRHFERDPISKERVPDDVLSAMHDAMLTSRQAAERAGRVVAAVLGNEMMSPPARQRQAKNEAGKIIEGATKRLDSSREKALTTAAALRESIAVPRRRVDATTTIVDGEVRARLAALPADARRDILREAIRVGDEQIVGAALAGPAMLSGFADRAEREEFRLQWQTAHCAAELSRIERIEKAVLDVERAGGLMIGFLVSLTDEQVIARAEESERRAQEALAN